MKKIIAFCLCIIMCLTFAACGNKGDIEAPMGFKLASDPEIPDYYLFVPEKWTTDVKSGTTTAYLKATTSNDIYATFVASFAPVDNPDITLENYFESYSKEFSEVFGDPANVETKDILLSKVPAKQYIYTSSFGEKEYKYWQVICMRNNRAYTLTFSTTSDLFDSHSEDMVGILEHFKFN